MLDQFLKYIAIFSIRLYQLLGRRFIRRTCLFHPSCSRRALFYFRHYGFQRGLRLTQQQLSECRGDYSLRLNPSGEVEMITHSGEIVAEQNINPKITMRLKQFQFMPVNNHLERLG